MSPTTTPDLLAGLVEYRDGVHLRDSILWFDADTPRDLSFISHCGVPGATRHGKIVVSAECAELLQVCGARRRPTRGEPQAQVLATPCRRPFSLGALSLELIPSGHSYGAASLLVQTQGQQVVYAGPLNTRRLPLAERVEVRRCGVLVVPLPEEPLYRKDGERQAAEAAIMGFVAQTVECLQLPVLLCPQGALAPHLAHLLVAQGYSVKAHTRIYAGLRVHGVAKLLDMTRIRRYRGRLKVSSTPEVLLWPMELGRSKSLAQLSRARVAAVAEALRSADWPYPGVETTFRLSLRGDIDSLAEYVRACAPHLVIVVGAAQDDPALRRLEAEGFALRVIGPRRQLPLFS